MIDGILDIIMWIIKLAALAYMCYIAYTIIL